MPDQSTIIVPQFHYGRPDIYDGTPWSADDLAAALAARNRAACGPVAPPDGLYLVRVEY